ncbi:MAG: trypsin-like peptidase domain-containing protein [Oculatellaceae cyanobacterium Prado106]|jgi:S1-C subfamily serine protease|nr:trypsin-like peptidase domain-containing protein [Oculatellaceae cyanobacterium Prado106]
MLKRLISFLAAPFLLPVPIALAQEVQPTQNQKLTLYAKPAVVRVMLKCSAVYTGNLLDNKTRFQYPFIYGWDQKGEPDVEIAKDGMMVGSGFIISSDGYIVTNAHVVEHATKSLEDCRSQMRRNLAEKLEVPINEIGNILNNNPIQEEIFHLQDVLLPNANKDLKAESFPFTIKQSGTSTNDGGQDVAVLKIEVRNAPVLQLADTAELRIQDPIIVIGYPGVADVMPRAGDVESLMEATVTEGIISNPNKTLPDRSPIIQVDVLVAPGSSGSPVLNQKGQVIGIISFQNNDMQGNSIPFALPTATIQQYVRPSGALNKDGDTDLQYREGLALFWRSEYEQARQKFEAVTALFPQHSEANRLIRESSEKIAKIDRKQDYVPLLIGVGVAIAGLLVAYVILRRRPTSEFAGIPGESGTGNLNHYSVEPEERASRSGQTGISQNRSTLMSFAKRGSRDTLVAVTQATVELKNAQGETQRFDLRGNTHCLGRDRAWADMRVPETGWEVLSKRHATFKREGNQYRIQDGDGSRFSTNGVLVNGTRIPPEGHLLHHGDQIQIGEDENQVTGRYYQADENGRATSQTGSSTLY